MAQDKVPQSKPTDTEIAYLAGFFDGEGSVMIRRERKGQRRNPVYTLVIQLSNSHRGVMAWVIQHFGGFLLEKKERRKYRPHWIWILRCAKAQAILELVLPYLVVKREQAVAAIEFHRLQSAEKKIYEAGRRGPVPRTPEQMAYKERAKQLLHHLKRPHGTMENFVFDPSLLIPISTEFKPKNMILTNEQVREIRAAYTRYETPQRVFAARYGVSRSLIANIVCGLARPLVKR